MPNGNLQNLLMQFGMSGQNLTGGDPFLRNLLQTRATQGADPGVTSMLNLGRENINRFTGRGLTEIGQATAGRGISGVNAISNLFSGQANALANQAAQGAGLNLQARQQATQQLGQQNIAQAGLGQNLFGNLLQNQQFGQGLSQQQEQFLLDLGFREDQLAEMRRQFDVSQEFNLGDFLGQLLGGAGQVGGAALIASDRRVKDNIERVGISLNGVNIYEFNYKGDSTRFRGAMAQENPEASIERNGIKHLDYSKIDVDFEVV